MRYLMRWELGVIRSIALAMVGGLLRTFVLEMRVLFPERLVLGLPARLGCLPTSLVYSANGGRAIRTTALLRLLLERESTSTCHPESAASVLLHLIAARTKAQLALETGNEARRSALLLPTLPFTGRRARVALVSRSRRGAHLIRKTYALLVTG